MKTIYILLLMTFMSLQSTSQINYDLEVLSQPYENLTDTIQLSPQYDFGGIQESWIVPLGFDFQFIDRTYSELEVLFNNLFFDYDEGYAFYSYYDGLERLLPVIIDSTTNDYNISPVSYKVEGNPGNKIFKLEYKFAGFFEDTCTVLENCSYVSFQTWLYEEDNSIEVHFGPNHVERYVFLDDGLYGTYCAIQQNDESSNFYTGDPLNPSVITQDSIIPDTLGIWPSPAAGTVYRFTPVPIVAVHDKNVEQVKVYPSPVSDFLHIAGDIDATQYTIYDLLGTKMMARKMTNKINVSHLDPGVYSISFYKNTRLVGVQKFVKM